MNEQTLKRPKFRAAEATALVQKVYGLTGSCRELPRERDQNFYFRQTNGQEFVLKISSTLERKDVLEFQNAVVRHLTSEAPGFLWPQIRLTNFGEDIARVEQRGSPHFVRLLSYVPGRFLASVKPHKPDLLRSLGVFLATMDRALASFEHPAMERDLLPGPK